MDLHRVGMSPAAITDALNRAAILASDADGRIAPLIDLIERIELGRDALAIMVRPATLSADRDADAPGGSIRIEAPLQARQTGRAKPIVIGLDRRERRPDAELIAMVADARRWADELLSGATASVGEIERREGGRKGSVSRILPLAFLAPDIAEAILNGGQPEGLTAGALRRLPDLPLDWTEQRCILGFEPRRI